MKVIAANRKKMIEARTAAVKERSEGRPEQAAAIVKDSFQPAMQAYQQSQRRLCGLARTSL